jgi:hypothetical protein
MCEVSNGQLVTYLYDLVLDRFLEWRNASLLPILILSVGYIRLHPYRQSWHKTYFKYDAWAVLSQTMEFIKYLYLSRRGSS